MARPLADAETVNATGLLALLQARQGIWAAPCPYCQTEGAVALDARHEPELDGHLAHCLACGQRFLVRHSRGEDPEAEPVLEQRPLTAEELLVVLAREERALRFVARVLAQIAEREQSDRIYAAARGVPPNWHDPDRLSTRLPSPAGPPVPQPVVPARGFFARCGSYNVN
jgi:hypothetical protein